MKDTTIDMFAAAGIDVGLTMVLRDADMPNKIDWPKKEKELNYNLFNRKGAENECLFSE